MVLLYVNMNPPQVYTCSPSWTLLPPPSPYHPSGLSQCTSSKHPVSCIEPGLETRFIYDIINVSMPFSQIIPPSPSPTEPKRLFYTSVSLSLSCFNSTLLNVVWAYKIYLRQNIWLLSCLLGNIYFLDAERSALLLLLVTSEALGFDGASGKGPTCQCRRRKRPRFDPWVRKLPWRRAWQPTPVFLPGEYHGQRSLAGYRP